VTYVEADLEILWRRAFLRCRAAGASVDDAADCAQDAITELLARSDVKHPKAWVATVALHRYIDLCRRLGREHSVGLVPMPATGATDLPGPEEQAVGRAHARWLVGAMKSWPASTRLVCFAVNDAVNDNVPRDVIVERLGLTSRAVESHLTRARRLLRTLSLLGAAIAVTIGRAIRAAAPASKPVTAAALLVPSAVVVMLILGGSEPPARSRPEASTPHSAEPGPFPAQPARPQPATGNSPRDLAADQVPGGAPPQPDPAAPSTGTGAPGLEAPSTPDTPATPAEPPSVPVPGVDVPALPVEPPPLIQAPALEPPELPLPPTASLPTASLLPVSPPLPGG
jgi:DNA-directed RNA polymerase specialized sigma24 family protein